MSIKKAELKNIFDKYLKIAYSYSTVKTIFFQHNNTKSALINKEKGVSKSKEPSPPSD